MGEFTLVSVQRSGGNDCRSYATERAARAMAEWLARLRRYRGHILVMPDVSTRRLGPDGKDAIVPAAPTEQTELDLDADLKPEFADRILPGENEMYATPGFLGRRQGS